jgi:hypothetical protein
MTTRGVLGAYVLSLGFGATAFGQIVIYPDFVPVWIPSPVVVELVPVVAGQAPTGAPQAGGEARHYPPQQSQKPTPQRVVHERHYLSANQNVSNYLAAKPAQEYGPETTLIIRDYFITDEPVRAPRTTPGPVGNADDGMKAVPNDRAPRNSTGPEFPDDKSSKSGTVTAPNPSAADPNGRREPLSERNYPPSDEKLGPPAPPGLLGPEPTSVVVASRNGGTPMAEMELNFVDLAGTNNDVKGRTDGKGEYQAKLAPSRWQVFLVIGENERKSLGVILVKPTPGEPFKLQF